MYVVSLQEVDNWTTLVADVDEVFASRDVDKMAAKIQGMKQSLVSLSQLRILILNYHLNTLIVSNNLHLMRFRCPGCYGQRLSGPMHISLLTSSWL